MKLSILVVNWNTRDLVIGCIHSILKNPPVFDYEIIVVDNYSQDGSVAAIVSLLGHNKKIRVIPSLRNFGFAKANNLAYQNSSGEFVLMLNPDTIVRPQALQNMVEYLEGHPGVGILGPKLLNPDGTVQSSVRYFPGIWASMLIFSGLHRIFRPRKYLMDDFPYDHIAEVDQVMGAALLTRRKIIEHLDFLDENFWLWYEEVDFCKRVKQAGYQIKFYPPAEIIHYQAASFSQLEVYARKKAVGKSLVYYFKKNGYFWQVLLLRLSLPVVLFMAKFLDFIQKAFHFKIRPHAQ